MWSSTFAPPPFSFLFSGFIFRPVWTFTLIAEKSFIINHNFLIIRRTYSVVKISGTESAWKAQCFCCAAAHLTPLPPGLSRANFKYIIKKSTHLSTMWPELSSSHWTGPSRELPLLDTFLADLIRPFPSVNTTPTNDPNREFLSHSFHSSLFYSTRVGFSDIHPAL